MSIGGCGAGLVELPIERYDELLHKEAKLQSILRFAENGTVVASNTIWAIVGTEDRDEK